MTRVQYYKGRYYTLQMKLSALLMQQEIIGYTYERETEIDDIEEQLSIVSRKLDQCLMFDKETITNTTLDLAGEAVSRGLYYDCQL